MKKNNPLEITGSTQDDNKSWWENNPMTYSTWGEEPIDPSLYDLEFYQNLDNVFYTASKHFSHQHDDQPFSNLIDFKTLKGKRVLEIGCGQGSHAELLTRGGAIYTGIDLTERAVKSTSKRFEINKLNGSILQMDAEKMTFPDNSFDFVWSWGVIHHSQNTNVIVDHIYRVLSPNGTARIMVYHKNSLRYFIKGGLIEGILKGKIFSMSLYEVNMRFTDGAIATHYSSKEAKKLFHRFKNIKISIMDEEKEAYIPFFGKYLRKLFPSLMKMIDIYLLRRYGWFIFIDIEK